jgi:hypothetical protein
LTIESGDGARVVLNDIDLSRATLEARFPDLGDVAAAPGPVWWDVNTRAEPAERVVARD